MKAADLTLENCWGQFSKVGIPENAPRVQHDAMYQAFLAGMTTLLGIEQATRTEPQARREELFDRWRAQVDAEVKRIAEEPRH